MSDEVRVPVSSDADVVTAREKGRELSARVGFSSIDMTLIVTAISEVARNITDYAGEGEVALRVLHDSGREGIEVIASDEGPGIDDVELAMQDGFTTGNGLGLGLPGTRRLVDEFELSTRPGGGTRVRLVKWTRA